MIAQVVFDLPIDGPFDYLVPEHLADLVVTGRRVKASFGAKTKIGFVVGLLVQSDFPRLKSVQSVCDDSAVFNEVDLKFARDFSAYYGCSLGEALEAMLRNKEKPGPSVCRDHKPQLFLYRSAPSSYAAKIQEIIHGYRHSGQARGAADETQFLILVPDTFRGQTLSQQLPSLPIKIGTRSSVFETDGRFDCVVMIDEEDLSYKQEQTPMYETRQVLARRSQMYGFDIAWIGVSPSVELMAMVREGQIKLIEDTKAGPAAVRTVDLSNYKYLPGLVSPPVRDALEGALKAGKKSILVLNRRGSYRLTRCVDCGEILKCAHCDSALIYSRSEGKFLCRHCTYTMPGDTVCPKCHKPSWRSQGIGVEQLQTEIKKFFPTAKIISFEGSARKRRHVPLQHTAQGNVSSFSDFDVLITTQAVLRFQGSLKATMVAFIDFDAPLNRLEVGSAFNAFSLALHVKDMAETTVFLQTRNGGHYVLQSLVSGNIQHFYDEELKLRKELGFSPFKHWIKLTWRGKSEKPVRQQATQVYNALSASAAGNHLSITPPLADSVGRKRDQFRFNVMVQADEVPSAVALIKSGLSNIKRRSQVLLTLNVDP